MTDRQEDNTNAHPGQDLHEHDEGSVLEALEALPLTKKLRHPSLLTGEAVVRYRRRRGKTGTERRPRWWRPGQLTPHFNYREFYCKDGTRPRRGRKKAYRALCRQYLEPTRAVYGACTVTSGYRTIPWNDHVGGEDGSFHVNEWHDPDDVAADAKYARGSGSTWASKAKLERRQNRNNKGGVGTYNTFVHTDTRDYQSNWWG